MYTKRKELKQILKNMAILIRENKARSKDCQRDPTKWQDHLVWLKTNNILYVNLSNKYRHMHIAYCLLRGKTYEQVENKVKEGNSPNWTLIEDVMREYRDVEEIQCSEVIAQ